MGIRERKKLPVYRHIVVSIHFIEHGSNAILAIYGGVTQKTDAGSANSPRLFSLTLGESRFTLADPDG